MVSQEFRNSNLATWCCHMTTTRQFLSVAHDHMVVGHTHEDIDAFFGMLSKMIRQGDEDMRPGIKIRCSDHL